MLCIVLLLISNLSRPRRNSERIQKRKLPMNSRGLFFRDEIFAAKFSGRRTRDRTWDLGLVRAALFQLSYPPGTEKRAPTRNARHRNIPGREHARPHALSQDRPERAEPAAGLLDPRLARRDAADDDVVDPHLQGALGHEADVEVAAIAGVEVEPIELPALTDAGDLDARLVPRDRAAVGAQPQVAVVIHALDLRPEPHVVAGARLDEDPL